MKIAFIVLCHKNPKQINNYLNKLLEYDSEVFVHIDKKNYSMKNELTQNKRIHILPIEDSYSVDWGGINMIKATLALIKEVKKSKSNYDYVWLVSGQDYVISNTRKVIDYLNKNDKYNFIEIIDDSNKEYKRYNKLYEIAYPSWITKDKVYIKVIKRLYMLITGGFTYTFRIFRRKKPLNYKFAFGSQWWTLRTEAAFYILDFTENNPNFINYFNKSIIPDECFFQTIIFNSIHYKNIKNNLCYVNWKNNRRSPETIKTEDLKKLKEINKKYFMARKFDLNLEPNIFNEIDSIVIEGDSNEI